MRDYQVEFRPRWEAALEYLGLPKDLTMGGSPQPEVMVALADKLRAVEARLDSLATAPRDTGSRPPLEDEVM